MSSSTYNGPPLLDLTIDNITQNTNLINAQCSDARLKYLMSRLVTHLHDFARETRLSTEEWMAALNFLVGCGQISSDVRHVSFSFFPFCPGARQNRQEKNAKTTDALGVHPPVRHPRPLAAGRQHQPPEAAGVDRGLGAGTVPHARRADHAQRRGHVRGPRGRADAVRVHRQGHGGAPDPGRQDRRE